MKIMVVDDERLARERLLRLLAGLLPEARCLEAGDGGEALALVAEHEPDLVLLDIRMPEMDGIELAARLSERSAPPAVIFCTAYDEYALEALQHQTVAYLLKPVREADLKRALDNAGRVNRVQLASLQQQQAGAATGDGGRHHVSSHTHRGVETMAVDQVRCFIAEQKYVTACSPDRELLLPDTLKELEREFGERFLRVHRNALVALSYIDRLQRRDDGTWLVVLEGVTVRPAVSRRHLAAVKQYLLHR